MYSPVWRSEMYLIWVFLPHDFRVVVFSKLISIFFKRTDFFLNFDAFKTTWLLANLRFQQGNVK